MFAEILENDARVDLSLRRFTVAEYMRLAESGILAEEERVELIKGEIVETPPISIAHVSTKNRLVALLTRTFADRALVGINNPVQLDEFSLPQPDVVLLHLKENYYSDRHPGPDDVRLIVEVAEASIDYDRWVKAPLFWFGRHQGALDCQPASPTNRSLPRAAAGRLSHCDPLHAGRDAIIVGLCGRCLES